MTDIKSILEERGSNYGAFSGHAAIAQNLKAVCYEGLQKNERFLSLPGSDQSVVFEAISMITHKLGRIVNGDPLFEDSWVDIAGYATLVPNNTGGNNL